MTMMGSSRVMLTWAGFSTPHIELDSLWRLGGDEAVLRFIEAGGVGDRWTVLSTPTGYVVKKPDEPSKVAGGRWVERQRDDWPSSR